MAPPVAPGTVLGERYLLRKVEWTSPVGPVWLARDRVLDRAVLVQVPDDAVSGSAAGVAALQRAAARIAQVTHPGLLQVYDIGSSPPFVVLEHAAGGRLADRLQAGPMRPEDVARAVLSLARALEALHERGASHGSLGPANVLFDEEGRPKLFAVGAAEIAQAVPSVNVRAEQPRGYRALDPSPLPADVDRYALAALAFQMLTGRAPEQGISARSLRRSVPQAMDEVLQRALSQDPSQRPTLDELEGALAPFARVEPPEVRGPRFQASELGWLLPVVLIVALAVAATTVGVQWVRSLADRETEEQRPRATQTAQGRTIEIRDVDDFDPPPGNGEESPRRVPLAVDGDARTSWNTVGYASERLGGSKDGVGLLLDLGDPVEIRRMRVQSTLPGWRAQVRVAEQREETAAGYREVASFTAAVDNDVALPPATRARYVLLWIVRLADDDSGDRFPFKAEIAEVELFTR